MISTEQSFALRLLFFLFQERRRLSPLPNAETVGQPRHMECIEIQVRVVDVLQ